MIILGIDPGTTAIGYGLIKTNGNESEIIDYGCIFIKPKSSATERLKIINQKLMKLLEKYKPNKAAVENIFFYKNIKTAMRVSEARGVILFTIAKSNIPIEEYTPLQVKQAVTGYGRAEKKQVQEMIKMIFNLKNIPKPDDAADALAVAVCCAHSITAHNL